MVKAAAVLSVKASPTPAKSTGRASAKKPVALKLVHKFEPLTIQPAPGKPKRLSPEQIDAMLKTMKVA